MTDQPPTDPQATDDTPGSDNKPETDDTLGTDDTSAPNEVADTDTDSLERFFESYRDAYTNLDLEAVLDHYSVPLLSVTREDRFWLTSESDLESVMGAYLEQLRERGYDHGEIDAISYHVLSEQDVLVSSAWTRYTTDDEVLERLGTTYLCCHTGQGWRIVALVLHDPETMIE